MNTVLYNEVPGYKFGDWKKYARHTDKEIAGFFGPYRWLSNFEVGIVYFEGLDYASVECAYQAAKYHPDERAIIRALGPTEAKKYSREHPMELTSKEWNEMRDEVMIECVSSKFMRSRRLRNLLIETGDKHLEETNHWGDTYWGVCQGKGQNRLGEILMATRSYWKTLLKHG